VPVGWAKFGILTGLNKFLSRLVTINESLLYHNDPERMQQSMEWRHSCSPRPQRIPSRKIRLKICRLDFLASRLHLPHWLTSKEPNEQYGVLCTSAGAVGEHFEGKLGGKFITVFLFLHCNCPVSWAIATQKKLTYLVFHCLDHPPYSPDLASSATICSLDWKINLNSPFFGRRGVHCCRGVLFRRTILWIFWVACKI